MRILECRDFASPRHAIDSYLEQAGAQPPATICLAVAAHVVDGRARFLNSEWSIDQAELEACYPDSRVRLVNDFQAVAHAIPVLGEEMLEAIGERLPAIPESADFVVGIVGPGTGLGAGALLRVAGNLKALPSEGGHWGFAPESPLQRDLLQALSEHHERVSDERLVSGPGIENVYRALHQVHGQAPVERTAAEVFEAALAGDDPLAVETEQLFWEVLGQVAGNLALALGARDGLYVAGGIARRYPERIRASRFRAGFENKGRHRGLMEGIPTALIVHPQPGLLGAAALARQTGAA